MTREDVIEFRLYVVGDLPISRRAIENLRTFCQQYLPGHHNIEVLDVFDVPQRALADHILLTPQLVVICAGQTQNIVGDLSETDSLRRATHVEKEV